MMKKHCCENCLHLIMDDESCFCENLEDDWTPTHEQMMEHEYQEKMALLDDVESSFDDEWIWPSESDISLVHAEGHEEQSDEINVDCRIGSVVKPSQTIN